tara:strand:+ start:16160 stop:16798 length:639 start_codon:yes stop_codon:yes gene_type:complete
MKFETEQEKFWAEDFGNDYIKRNNNKKILSSNLYLFSNCLKNTSDINSCIEFGSNIGLNLKALKILFPNINISAIEINEMAISSLKKTVDKKNIYHQSIINFSNQNKWDLALIKGVLIHINPDQLSKVYDNLYNSTKKYILLCEYYSRLPTNVEYYGFKDKLFKRDFCGEMLDRFKDLELVDYGFIYHRAQNFPQDDINWFLLRKIGNKNNA